MHSGMQLPSWLGNKAMGTNKNHITVFEHQVLRLNHEMDGVKFDAEKLKAMQTYFGEKGVPYFSLIHNGIQFTEYVGVIQVGNLVIEVLPKADKQETNTAKWQHILFGMLRSVGLFNIHAPSSSSLQLKSNSILDLYFELFIREIEYLLHNGLVKQYRKKEGNVTALKGNLQFGKHIQQNLTHQERFFVRHTTYDVNHKFHFILYKTICLLKQINTNVNLHSRIGSLLLHFPEMPDIKVSDATFDKLVFTRKNQSYRKAIEIARLLLLNYHPDVMKGRNHVLALMFDMNNLWEQFVYVSLRKFGKDYQSVVSQSHKYFWKPDNGNRCGMRADIVMRTSDGRSIVLDTKWKNLNGYNPGPDDLRQMYVYHKYYYAEQVALVYPGTDTSHRSGTFLHPDDVTATEMKCSVITISVKTNIKMWQENICKSIEAWVNANGS